MCIRVSVCDRIEVKRHHGIESGLKPVDQDGRRLSGFF